MNAEELNDTDKDTAIAQAVELAEYVTRQAKGEMVKAAQRFLSLPYAQKIAQQLERGKEWVPTPRPPSEDGACERCGNCRRGDFANCKNRKYFEGE